MFAARAFRIARDVLAAEWGCTPVDFDRPGVLVTERPDEHGAWPAEGRRYTTYQPALALVSFGRGTVVAASAALLPETRALFAGLDRDDAFETVALAGADALLRPHGYTLAGPLPRLICGVDTLRLRVPPAGITIAIEEAPTSGRLRDLGVPEHWPNAISRRALASGKQEAAIAVARAGQTVVGIASAGRDALMLWQIGIDVAKGQRGTGVGVALTSTLARWVLDHGAVPWYGLAPANLPSLRTALAAGFVPAWLEAFTYGPVPSDLPSP